MEIVTITAGAGAESARRSVGKRAATEDVASAFLPTEQE